MLSLLFGDSTIPVQVDGRDLLPEEDDLDREFTGEDELFALAIASELLLDAGAEQGGAEEEESRIGRNYALSEEQISKALAGQLEEMTAWRTEVRGTLLVTLPSVKQHALTVSHCTLESHLCCCHACVPCLTRLAA